MTDWALFLGRFHPLVLHLPIGLLVGAYLLTLLALRPRFRRHGGAARLLVLAGALASVGAAVPGYLLALGGGYDETLVAIHRWTGITLALLTLVLAWMARRPEQPRAYVPLFTACMALMVVVGHFGGTLTHGSGYLVAHAPQGLRAILGGSGEGSSVVVVEDLELAGVLQDLVMPVLDASCSECHNPVKRKGGLDLTTPEGLSEGGESGALLPEDGALGNELFRRLILPSSHRDAMPPSGRARLDPAEVELIGWWLDEGAPADATVAELSPDERRLRALRARFGRPDPLELLGIRPPSPRALARAAGGPFIVERVSGDAPYVRARLPAGFTGDVPSLGVLEVVRAQLTELDVGNSRFGDEAARGLPAFQHLRRLFMHRTDVTDASMERVAELPYLRHLNVYGTRVTAGGLDALTALEHLERIYAWESGVGAVEGDVNALLGGRVDVGVDQGRYAASQLPPPLVSVDSVFFRGQATVALGGSVPGSEIRYTVDGTEPTQESPLFREPFAVARSVQLRAVAFREGWVESPAAEATLLKRDLVTTDLRLSHPPDEQYPGNGAETLMDGDLGTTVFDSPSWLGYKADLEALIDLGSSSPVGEVVVSVLEATESWIFPPVALDVALSSDGITFRAAADATYTQPTELRPSSLDLLRVPFVPSEARWVRVRVKSLGTLPEWHPGSGEAAWLFVSEILVGRGS